MKREQEDRFQDPTTESRNFGAFGPPDFSQDETDVFDNEALEAAYQNPAFLEPEFEDEPQNTYDQPVEEDDDDDEIPTFGFTPPPNWEQRNRPAPEMESLREEGGAFLRDDSIFEGGPARTEVMSWKKQFEQDSHTVNLTEVGDEVFIWRTLNRIEYREIMALPNTDPLQREEVICEVCVLFPYEYNFSNMSNRKAGTPAVLAEEIMRESGFKKVAPPVRL